MPNLAGFVVKRQLFPDYPAVACHVVIPPTFLMEDPVALDTYLKGVVSHQRTQYQKSHREYKTARWFYEAIQVEDNRDAEPFRLDPAMVDRLAVRDIFPGI